MRGGIRLANQWGTWPSAKLEFTSDQILIDFMGAYAIEKADVEKVLILRGMFTTEFRIEHRCSWTEEPVRFFAFGAPKAIDSVKAQGFPCEIRKAPFYSKGDIRWYGD